MKDLTVNRASVFVCNGATGHSIGEREPNDYYATEPKAASLLCDIETFSRRIWEPACGEGHLAKIFVSRGYDVLSTDLIPRGYGTGGVDFLAQHQPFDGDIVTNPPYRYAQQFVEHALDLIHDGHKVAMLLKLTFLESKARRALFDRCPPVRIWVASSRLQCGINGDFSGAAAMAYAWFIWQKGFAGEPVVKWFN